MFGGGTYSEAPYSNEAGSLPVIRGTFTQTLALPTWSLAGTIVITTGLNETLGPVLDGASAQQPISADLAEALRSIIETDFTGNIFFESSLSTTLGDMYETGMGYLYDHAAFLDLSLDSLGIASSGVASIAGALTRTLDPLVASASLAAALSAALTKTLAPLTLSSSWIRAWKRARAIISLAQTLRP